MAATCLEIFHLILDQFQINENDLEETVKSPGYGILVQLLNDSGLLAKTMTVVQSGATALGKGERLTGQHLSAVRAAVRVLALVLELQEDLLAMLRDSNATAMVTPLQQLLLSVNPTTKKTDFILSITKLVRSVLGKL